MAKSANSQKSTPNTNVPTVARITLAFLKVVNGETVLGTDVRGYLRDAQGNIRRDENGKALLGDYVQAFVHGVQDTELGNVLAGDGTTRKIVDPDGYLTSCQIHLSILCGEAEGEDIVKYAREIVEVEKLKAAASKGNYGFRVEFFSPSAK